MPNITVYWYKHMMERHHRNLKLLMKFYYNVVLHGEHAETFKGLVGEIEDVFNSQFADTLNAKMEERRENPKTDELPF